WHWDFNTGSGDVANQGLHQIDVARWFLGVDALPPRVVSFGGRLGYDDAGDTPNTQVAFFDYPDAPLIFETRGLPRSKEAQQKWENSMDDYRGVRIGVVVQCEKGYVVSTDNYGAVDAFNAAGETIKSWRGGGDHFANFLDAVQSHNAADLNAPVVEGHISSALCHAANISHALGEPKSAGEIMESASENEVSRDSLERMLAHLRANEVDVDQPLVTAGAQLQIDPAIERFIGNDAANNLLHRKDREPFVVPSIG
ncbi:MAG: gfo/Idh/MocA family oxidoreductase, partial [Planctomycetales bacterium]|nr:gfo/Idh/MocA family oxidoreductase [Planctomycetales bacterium]